MNAAVFAIARKDLRQRFRDRSALVLGFVAPVLIAAIMNVAFSGTEDFHATLGVADADRSALGGEVVAALRSPELADIVTIELFDDEAAVRRAVDGGDIDAGVVVPAGFSTAAAVGAPADLAVLTSVDAKLAGDVAASIAASFTTRLAAVRLAVVAALDAGAPHSSTEQLVAEALATSPPAVVVDRPTGTRQLEGVAYYGPGMAMFFVLFAVGFTARGFFRERAEGTLDRIAAAPVRPGAVVGGKALSVFVYSTASLGTMALVTDVVFGASWGSPLGVAALCVGMAAAVVALSALVMSAARSERQGETLASATTFTLALLGGNFVFLGVAPPVLRTLSRLTPNGWALRGFTDLATGAPTLDAIATPLLGMAVFTAVVGAIAVLAGRRAVVR